MQTERVLGEAVHYLSGTHVVAAVVKAVGLPLVGGEQRVCTSEVAYAFVVLPQIGVAYVADIVAWIHASRLAAQYRRHLTCVVAVQGQAYLYGVDVIHRHGVAHALEVRLHEVEASLRLVVASEVEVNVSEIEPTKVEIEV